MSKKIIPGGIEHIFKKMNLSESQAKQVTDYVQTLLPEIGSQRIKLNAAPSNDSRTYQSRIFSPLFGNKNVENIAEADLRLDKMCQN